MNVKPLIEYAYRKGEDVSQSLHQYLDYLMKTFDPDLMNQYGNRISLMYARQDENRLYFELMMDWLEETADAMDSEKGWTDYFGRMYEEVYKGKSKASQLGQFYTPEHISELLASLHLCDDGREVVNDAACGSGRNLLAHYAKANKSKPIFYEAGDIDLVSCKMCALNMMAHGMIGVVVCHDALADNEFKQGWMINEVRYPLPSNWYSIRPITKEEFVSIKHKVKSLP